MIGRLLVENVALIGFMGAGKTSVGRILADRTGLTFRDLDAEIERQAGLSVAEIFERHGEPVFREQERVMLARLCAGANQVIACGGGTLLDVRNRDVVKERCVAVWLRVSQEEILRRVKRRGADARPLLQGVQPERVVPDLLRVREPIYQGADLVVETDGRGVGEVADEIRRGLGLALLDDA
jgi:shikimate kinase